MKISPKERRDLSPVETRFIASQTVETRFITPQVVETRFIASQAVDRVSNIDTIIESDKSRRDKSRLYRFYARPDIKIFLYNCN